jgi:hypothetical protein
VAVRPLVCVHGAHVDVAGRTTGVVEIIPAGRLRASLTSPGPQPRSAHVAALVARTHIMLRPTCWPAPGHGGVDLPPEAGHLR